MDIDTQKTKLIRGSSYIELPLWVANKKAAINPKIVKITMKMF